MQITTVDLYEYFHVNKKNGEDGRLTCYYIEEYPEFSVGRLRPAMLVIPGGGYGFVSEREGQPIALKYAAEGFQAFVLNYTVSGKGGSAKYPVPLVEAAMASAYIRQNAEKFSVLPDKIACIGFSAGGHLAAMLSNLTGEPPVKEALGEKAKYAGVNAAVLGYPVITFKNECGTRKNLTEGDESLYAPLSMESRVTKNTPPTFLWSTAEDDCVPIENTVLYMHALIKNGVPFEAHIYEKGHHGLSLANEETECRNRHFPMPDVAKWWEEALRFLRRHGFAPVFKD